MINDNIFILGWSNPLIFSQGSVYFSSSKTDLRVVNVYNVRMLKYHVKKLCRCSPSSV